MLGEDVLFQSVAELAPQIRARRISPIELTEAYLARIERHAASLNAFARVTPDLAREQARAAEKEINGGHYRGPLHGLPYGAKDLLATAGIPTEWGAHPCKGQTFDRDATVVRKLREAGAVLLGKCAMVEFAGCLGYRYPSASASGPGRNPWNRERWTGGSSSGSGAAVAAGLVGFAIGTETWGSILCPSAFCGITGLRPTYGRVSRAGGMVGSWTFDKIGPLARSAADCRLILEAIAGADPDDPTSSHEPVALGTTHRAPKQIRAALVPLDFAKTKMAEPEVKERFDAAVAELRAAGLDPVETKLPEFPASEMAGLIITAEALSTFENFYRDGSIAKLVDAYAPWQPEINRAIGCADLVKAWRMRRVLQEKTAEFFAQWDVIVTPNFMSVAPPVAKDLYDTLPYADPVGAIGNACGLPAIALPCGFGRDHMPAGFQIMAAPWDEALLLDLGERYQKRTAFHREHPALA
ncbi:MAG: amidase [Candidatus Eisenbacteria bacterium]|uniref:Amidase n=1 Tax=Eiseniibacteriota bacterium TaxID=2212470 RepID=A0A9D6L7E6_UNCEI|nr:amidase [Candidatus Eisenbacteria bacterium]MBI3540001.1 amidase [Candidatus Eisenbacteria bacterium]